MKKQDKVILENVWPGMVTQFKSTEQTLKDAAGIVTNLIKTYPQFVEYKIKLIRNLKLNYPYQHKQ